MNVFGQIHVGMHTGSGSGAGRWRVHGPREEDAAQLTPVAAGGFGGRLGHFYYETEDSMNCPDLACSPVKGKRV